MSRKRAFGYRVGAKVVYPSHGVGEIKEIISLTVDKQTVEMFKIYFANDGLTLRIPTERVSLDGLRKITSEEELDKALTVLKGRARVKKSMWSRRAVEYDQKINSGDIIQLVEVVRDLHKRDPNKDQSYSERQLYDAAYNRLAREISAVRRITFLEAKELIVLQLRPKRSTKPLGQDIAA